jgi:hypothetical protein
VWKSSDSVPKTFAIRQRKSLFPKNIVTSAQHRVAIYCQRLESPKKAATAAVFALPQRVIKSVDFALMRVPVHAGSITAVLTGFRMQGRRETLYRLVKSIEPKRGRVR